MEVRKISAFPKRQVQWNIELVVTDMFWCNLLVDASFCIKTYQPSSFLVDYRINLENKLSNAFDAQHVYLLCRREKIRFDIIHPPRYNVLTKKTKFHFLIGKNKRKTSISVDLKTCFFLNKPNPKIIIETDFVNVLINKNEYLTLSIHDFLSSIGVDLGSESEVVSVGCTCSPYRNSLNQLKAFQQEITRFFNEDDDLLVYINTYNMDLKIKTLHFASSDRVVFDVKKPSDCLFLMLMRSLTLYFFEVEEVSSIAVKNARENLFRFFERNQISWIKIVHAYEIDNKYTRLNSNNITGSANHTFTVSNKNNHLVVSRSELFT